MKIIKKLFTNLLFYYLILIVIPYTTLSKCTPGKCALCELDSSKKEICKKCYKQKLEEGSCAGFFIPNCYEYEEQDKKCKTCIFNHSLSTDKLECRPFPSNVIKNCILGEYRADDKTLKCTGCKGSYPAGETCGNGFGMISNCKAGGKELKCIKCPENYFHVGYGCQLSCGNEWCAKCGRNSECLECNYKQGFWATGAKKIEYENGIVVFEQICELGSEILGIIFWVLILIGVVLAG